jgi:hypothetical protein
VKVAGFTFIRNAVKYDYPVTESILSIVPLCDEVIVNIGESDDGTAELIKAIPSSKIKIFYSVWDESLKEGGRVLAAETDKAFDHVPADTDWCVYLQADEVIHEKYHALIREAMLKYKDDPNVEGLLFNYLHFYGSYDYIGDSRTWYSHEIRVIRNDKSIRSYRDAQGFRKHGKKLQVKSIDAYVYHYGWVKDPRQQLDKHLNFEKLYSTTRIASEAAEKNLQGFDYSWIDSLEKFTGTHPATMQQRIQQKNWTIDLDMARKRFTFKDRLLYWIEKKTGKRLFAYRNYKIV